MKENNIYKDNINKNIDFLAIVGPTAVGKTKLSIQLAKKIGGELVNADSMQVYKDLNIGVAKPTEGELDGVRCHLIDFVGYDQKFNLNDYLGLAKEKIMEVKSRGKMPILVGGTGLYVDSVVNDIDLSVIPEDFELREKLKERYDRLGAEFVWNELFELDSKAASKIPANNKKRIVRALEVNYLTGKTLEENYLKTQKNKNINNTVIFGLSYKNRDLLYDKINKRVDDMICDGLVSEVEFLMKKGMSETSVQAIGYKEFRKYFDGEKTLEQTIEEIKQNTRKYAKRQLTWFRRNESIKWINIDEYENFDEIINFCLKTLEKSNWM